jgi:hypothetical protein
VGGDEELQHGQAVAEFDLIGRGMISPFGLATRPRIPAICRICIQLPRAPEETIR